MNFRVGLCLIAAGPLAICALASQLNKGTEVYLTFRQPVSSKTAKAGDTVKFTVTHDVMDSSGHVVIARGTPVMGVISKVDQNDHFGKNARIRIALNPVDGIQLQPRDKGKLIGGTRSDEAGAASGGAALIFGPLGLVGGYFVVGHKVNIHTGDQLRTEVGS